MADQNNKPSPFGNTGSASSGGFGFGKASTGTPSSGLFGSNNAASSSSAGGAILFGSAPKPADESNKSANPAPLFGSLSTPSKPPTPNPGALTTPANSQGGPSNGSTTPVVSPPAPSGSLFGQNFSGGASTFGNLGGGQNSSTSAPPASSLFSTNSSSTPKSMFGAQPSQTSANLFGGGAASTGGSLFGQKPNQEQTPQEQNKGSSNLFGGAPAPSSAGSTQKPALFGGPTTTSTAPTSAPTTAAPALFGSVPASSAQQQPGSTTSTASNPFGNPFGTPKPDAQTTGAQSATASTTAAAAAPTTSLFGSSSSTSQAPAPQSASTLFGGLSKPASTSAPSSSQPASAPALFGSATTTSKPAAAASTSAANATSQPSTAPSTTAGAPTSAATTTSAPPFASSTAGPAPTPQSRLKNKTMDEIITRWATDLKKYQKEFQTQADKVAQWDRLLVENSNAITKLYSRTFQAERDTSEVQKQLSAVEDNQAELSQWLDRYEQEVEGLMAKEGMGQREGLQGPDQERERTYKAAERVQEKLSDMGNELTGLIEEINSVSSSLSNNSKPDDPLSQIVRVLNTHLSQLQQIDQDTAALQAKVAAAKADSQRLGYRSNGISSAADDFYRSLRSTR